MSMSATPYLIFVSQQVTIYLGAFLFAFGLFGGLLNIIVFLSLQTFRENSCAFYLTAMSFANIAHLCFSFLPHIFINGYGIDWTSSSMIFCKLRFYCIQLWLLTSFTCMCLATIDQFLSTCSNPRWHRWSQTKYARYIVVGWFLVWMLHGIPSLIYYNLIKLQINPSQSFCFVTNRTFQQYFFFGFILILMGTLPLIIMVVFGLLAYYNVRNLAYRTVPLVQRALDKQITQMVLVQVLYNSIVLAPYVIFSLATVNSPINVTILFLQNLIILIHNFYFASPFYIYFSVSKRFRQQLYYVFCTIHYNRWRQQNVINNQVAPNASINAN